MNRVVHRVTDTGDGWQGPAWCDSAVYPDDGATDWPKVSCRRCIRIGGDTARDEIGAAKAEARSRPAINHHTEKP
jgi:hypothetical protein